MVVFAGTPYFFTLGQNLVIVVLVRTSAIDTVASRCYGPIQHQRQMQQEQEQGRETAECKRREGGWEKLQLCCYKCKMGETLWVCLTCCVIGCGRYSHGHAEAHYRESGHPFSLELVTRRIWDYDTGEFVHRNDLLKCPSIQQQLPPLAASAAVPGRSGATATATEARMAMMTAHSGVGSTDYSQASGVAASSIPSSASICSANVSFDNGAHHQSSSSFDGRDDAYASYTHPYPLSDCGATQ
eukprot:15022392-Ditylum_brightwellii.AAC.1